MYYILRAHVHVSIQYGHIMINSVMEFVRYAYKINNLIYNRILKYNI